MKPSPVAPLPDLSELHPYCRGLLARWDAARGPAFAPSWRTLDLVRIAPSAALPHCTMAEPVAGGAGLVYRFFGTWHAILHDHDLTGKTVDAIRPAGHPERLKAEYAEAIARRAPVAFRSNIPVQTGTRARREVIRLPLSDNGTDVSAVVAATVFLEGEKEALAYFRAHQRSKA